MGHGFKSVHKMEDFGVFIDIESSSFEYFRYIVEMHDHDDEEAFSKVNEYNIQDKERAKYLLKLFKDCDNLDRVRINDLNINYLRLENTKKMVMLSYELFYEIK